MYLLLLVLDVDVVDFVAAAALFVAVVVAVVVTLVVGTVPVAVVDVVADEGLTLHSL